MEQQPDMSNEQVHAALLPSMPGVTFGQVRRAAARVRDPKRALTTYGQETPVWDADQRAYIFPASGELVPGDDWRTASKGDAGRESQRSYGSKREADWPLLPCEPPRKYQKRET